MKYVLIFVVVTKVFGAYSVTAEFDDQTACMVALNKLIDLERATFSLEPHNAQMIANCEPKGSAK